MDKEVFVERFNSCKKITPLEKLKDIVDTEINAAQVDGFPRGHKGLIVAMGELAELSQALSKYLRGKGDYYSVLEEAADVALVLLYVQNIVGISDTDLEKAVSVKAHRIFAV